MSLIASLALLAFTLWPLPASAWNIPGHMLSGAIAYQILRSESPATIAAVRATLERHPWYERRWKEQLDSVPPSERDELLFMLAPRWADDIRRQDQDQHRGPWHYIDWPFKPEGQPATVQPKPPERTNVQTALLANEKFARGEPDPKRRSITLAWVFHLVGDIHQPLHTTQIFTTDYSNGDRGGNEICIRPTPTGKPMDLHRFWDGVITSSQNHTRLRNEATALRNRTEFARESLHELAAGGFQTWVYEGHLIAREITYQNGAFRGTHR